MERRLPLQGFFLTATPRPAAESFDMLRTGGRGVYIARGEAVEPSFTKATIPIFQLASALTWCMDRCT